MNRRAFRFAVAAFLFAIGLGEAMQNARGWALGNFTMGMITLYIAIDTREEKA